MNKEEILKKAQEEKEDEGKRDAEIKGLNIGFKVFGGLCIFLTIFNLINGIKNFEIITLLFAFLAGDFYSRYKFTGEKRNMLVMILAGITSGVNLLAYVLSVMV